MSDLHKLLNRKRPGSWQKFCTKPCIFLARHLYTWRQYIPAAPIKDPVSIVCISDTHNIQVHLPDGDILIHAGDLTQSGSFKEIQEALSWLRSQPHHTKIIIAGNHDRLLDKKCDDSSGQATSERARLEWGDLIYLENEQREVVCANGRRLNVFGSPYSARHGNWAFQYPKGEDVWVDSVPEGIDVLITHTPPNAHLDLLKLGCVQLLKSLWRVQPRLHVFGHIHEGAGIEWISFDKLQLAYERTVATGGGVKNLLWTIWEFGMAWFSPVGESKCLLINSSIIGGLRDNERREPVIVVI
ncbi:hypothetical protein N7462_010180 [Penicillium macrosclerotiorum]|uniref:uncharacterized protein n=1 Tax=Penicillium macrosclerotiorum TaxID=303699 RepID=UPI002546D6E4|nr:uncharacterized protein N7462_010180 [Penicillium macrosclerotiorum]KAJ5669110.1 hypothetical protein N7462_010180 [Penicillium macrosclerotiorum]